MIVIFCLRTKNSCRISKSTTLPQVTSDIITFSRMVRFSCVLPLWKAIELTIMPVLTVLKNIENWPFYSQSRKTWHFFWDTLYINPFRTSVPKISHYKSYNFSQTKICIGSWNIDIEKSGVSTLFYQVLGVYVKRLLTESIVNLHLIFFSNH